MKRFKFMAGVLLIALCVGSVFAQNEADFETDGNGTITKYTGWDTVIVIPASIGGKPVTGIGEGAFRNINLTGVTIPATVKTIGKNAFSGNRLTNVVISAGVTSIGSGAFSENQLTGVTIPATVKTIGDNAFADNKLTNVVIPEGVTFIGEWAFNGNQLTRLTLPGSVTSIGNGAFGINKIPTVTLGANIRTSLQLGGGGRGDAPPYAAVAINIFYDYICNGSKAGTYTYRQKDSADWLNREWRGNRTEDGFMYFQTQYGIIITGYNGSGANALRIPERINNLPVRVILSLSGISRVLIPDSVTYIGNGAFSGNALTSVTIPNSVTYIGDSAFSSNQLTSVTIPDSVTYIGDGAFSRNALTSVTISNSVTSIGANAFSGNALTSVTIPDSVTIIWGNAFSGNALTSVTMPANVAIVVRRDYGSFGNNGLEDFYQRNGDKAGTYTRPDTRSRNWTPVEEAAAQEELRKEQESKIAALTQRTESFAGLQRLNGRQFTAFKDIFRDYVTLLSNIPDGYEDVRIGKLESFMLTVLSLCNDKQKKEFAREFAKELGI